MNFLFVFCYSYETKRIVVRMCRMQILHDFAKTEISQFLTSKISPRKSELL